MTFRVVAVSATAAVAVSVYLLWRRHRASRLDGRATPLIITEIPGPKSRALIDRLSKHECPAITARRARRADALGAASADPIVWDQAAGCNVRDVDGNVFVDITSGFGVATVGHCSAAVMKAASKQIEHQMLHAMGDAFADPSRIELLELLASIAPAFPKGILGCSGADAVQAALKTAALKSGRSGVLAFSGGYHGLAHGALAPSAYKANDFRAPFAAQLGAHVTFAPFGQLPLPPLRANGIGCVLVEPIQGRGGVRSAPVSWLAALRAHCDAEGALLVYDEIYSGFGRTGSWFAYQELCRADEAEEAGAKEAGADDVSAEGSGLGGGGGQHEEASIAPDMLCLGKAMGGGCPISVCLGTREAMDAWGASKGESLHTQTFLGNPLCCAMAVGALKELQRLDAPRLARQKGDELRALLHEAGFKRVRGRGLMLAVEVANPLKSMVEMLCAGVIALPVGEGSDFAMGIVPPLTITRAQMCAVVDALRTAEIGEDKT